MKHRLILPLLGSSVLLLSVCAPLSWANDHEEDTVLTYPVNKHEVVDHKAQENISDVLQLVEAHVRAGIVPSKIAVVFDVDGTLTDQSYPGDHIVKERYGSTAIVLKLLEMGVRVAISSAWNRFNETLDRLDALGLTQALKIEDRAKRVKGTYQSMLYYQLGLVASVQNDEVDNIYYRQKAFAPYIIYNSDTMDHIEKVIFADDSSGNIKYFKNDVKNHHLFPNATQMDYFYLTEIKGSQSEDSIATGIYPETALDSEEESPDCG